MKRLFTACLTLALLGAAVAAQDKDKTDVYDPHRHAAAQQSRVTPRPAIYDYLPEDMVWESAILPARSPAGWRKGLTIEASRRELPLELGAFTLGGRAQTIKAEAPCETTRVEIDLQPDTILLTIDEDGGRHYAPGWDARAVVAEVRRGMADWGTAEYLRPPAEDSTAAAERYVDFLSAEASRMLSQQSPYPAYRLTAPCWSYGIVISIIDRKDKVKNEADIFGLSSFGNFNPAGGGAERREVRAARSPEAGGARRGRPRAAGRVRRRR